MFNKFEIGLSSHSAKLFNKEVLPKAHTTLNKEAARSLVTLVSTLQMVRTASHGECECARTKGAECEWAKGHCFTQNSVTVVLISGLTDLCITGVLS